MKRKWRNRSRRRCDGQHNHPQVVSSVRRTHKTNISYTLYRWEVTKHSRSCVLLLSSLARYRRVYLCLIKFTKKLPFSFQGSIEPQTAPLHENILVGRSKLFCVVEVTCNSSSSRTSIINEEKGHRCRGNNQLLWLYDGNK